MSNLKKEINSQKKWISIIHHDDREKVFIDGDDLIRSQKFLVSIYRITTAQNKFNF